jgi:hypothetical protein
MSVSIDLVDGDENGDEDEDEDAIGTTMMISMKCILS